MTAGKATIHESAFAYSKRLVGPRGRHHPNGMLCDGRRHAGRLARRHPNPRRPASRHERAAAFLAKSQSADGSFSPQAGPGVTAIVATGLLRNGFGPADPLVARSLKYLESKIQPDGGIYQKGTFYSNYETCLAMMALVEANADGRYAKTLKAAEAFIKGGQWDERAGTSDPIRPTAARATDGRSGPTCRTRSSSSRPCVRWATVPTIRPFRRR